MRQSFSPISKREESYFGPADEDWLLALEYRQTGDEKPMANYLYVDNSNVWIEGMRVAAVASGLAKDIGEAIEKNISDYGWKMDFGRLHEFAGGDDIGRAVLFGSRPPSNDSLWAVAEAKGFEVVVYDRSASNREKKIDTDITANIVADSYRLMKAGEDEITLVAGDKDYVPATKNIAPGLKFEVVFWDHVARELRTAASKFVSLNPYLEHLRLKAK